MMLHRSCIAILTIYEIVAYFLSDTGLSDVHEGFVKLFSFHSKYIRGF
jgi:hypothetical protein